MTKKKEYGRKYYTGQYLSNMSLRKHFQIFEVSPEKQDELRENDRKDIGKAVQGLFGIGGPSKGTSQYDRCPLGEQVDLDALPIPLPQDFPPREKMKKPRGRIPQKKPSSI